VSAVPEELNALTLAPALLLTQILPTASIAIPFGTFKVVLLPYEVAEAPFGVNFVIVSLPLFATHAFPVWSTANAYGELMPPDVKPVEVEIAAPSALNSDTLLLPEFATQTFPDWSVATSCGAFNPPPVCEITIDHDVGGVFTLSAG